ncbi:hypothetical protein KJ903_01965 [Patescibacteria group bacterium]|nr:hypothetical protein [Patescibacteria group bacterium]
MKSNIQQYRQKLLAEQQLTVIKEFDTADKENSHKDVTLCQNSAGQQLILRIGETRPLIFFPDGWQGENIYIPTVIFAGKIKKIPYEIEEFVAGPLLSDINNKTAKTGKIQPDLLAKLIASFWEVQEICRKLPLESKFSSQKIEKHFILAQKILSKPNEIEKIMSRNNKFWSKLYPSKWKFALDNLILTANNKIALIDNAKVGLRYFGYDLGWLVWPLWLEMEEKNYKKVAAHISYLEYFCKLVQKKRATSVKPPLDFNYVFWLIIFERIIGAAYDIVNNTKYLKKLSEQKIEKQRQFLNSLMKIVTEKISY